MSISTNIRRLLGTGCRLSRLRCPSSWSVLRCSFATSSPPSPSTEISLSYSEYGDEATIDARIPPLFITHGLLGAKQNWNSIAKAVSRLAKRKVYTIDGRNHGDSPHSEVMNYDVMCEDIIRLADQLDIQKFMFLGHSMGGRTAMSLALKYPKRMSKLIAVDISPLNLGGDFDQMKGYLETLISIKFDSVKTLSEARKYADTELKAVVREASVRAFLITNLAADGSRIYWKPNLPVLLQSLPEIKHFPEELLSRQCISPTLVIRGENSLYVPMEDFDGIRKIFPNVTFTTIKNAGHWPQADNPSSVIEHLVKFCYKQ